MAKEGNGIMIYFLIPMYNEELNLISLHRSLSQAAEGLDAFFVMVDDCSKDDSVLIAEELFERFPHKVITKNTNQGPGHSFNIGFEWILAHSQNQDDVIVTMEADNTSDISLLPTMLSLNKLGYNLVLASVYAQGGGFEKTSLFRKILSFGANMFLRAIYDVKVLTLSSFYRAYSVSLLKEVQAKYNGQMIKEHGFICMLEILLKSISCNAKIVEVPMLLKSDKRQGKSKMKVLKTAIGYLKFLANFRVPK